MENHVATVTPPCYRIIDQNTLIHAIVHTSHPKITEQIIVHDQGTTQPLHSELWIMNCIKIQYLSLLPVMYNSLNSLLHEFWHLYQALKEIYKFWRNFIFLSVILMILIIYISANCLLKMVTYMLHIVLLPEKFLLHFGLDWNLMQNCKHKELPNITGTNWILFRKTLRNME